MKRKIRAPFFCVNPKSYLYGNESIALAIKADELAKKYDLDIFFTGKEVDLREIKRNTSNIIVTAQNMDGIEPERAMGGVLPVALIEAGVEATFLNHNECQRTFNELSMSLLKANKYDILSIVCASTLTDVKALAAFEPDVMICELNELIGTGKVADKEYLINSTKQVKAISKNTLVLQAAGISTPEDVYNVFKYGGDGTGATSGIVCQPDPVKAMIAMIEAVAKAREDFF
jgi:triosephosphate isomerase